MVGILFLIIYFLIIMFNNKKELIALIGALLFIILNYVDNVFNYIDINVILMILGTMVTVNMFIESNMPSLLANILIKKISNSKLLIVVISIFAGIVSSFVDNVATVLMIVPIAMLIFKKANINPCVPVIIISIFSNLEGAATLIGDTTSMLLAKANNMNFLDFFIYNNKIGLFFIVQTSLIACSIIAFFIVGKKTKVTNKLDNIYINDYFPTFLLILNLVLLIVVSFIDIPNINGYTCIIVALIGLIKYRDIKLIKAIDFKCIILLCSLFILIGGIRNAGILDSISSIISGLNYSVFITYTIIVFLSVIISAFVDNIPYVATMLPVTYSVSISLGIDPTLLYFGLIVGSTLGGNLTPIGASCNVASIGILKKEGYNVSFKQYFKVSFILTLVPVLIGYILVYIIYR